ncbi:hypothetical protein HKK74_25910 [Actinomadura alba]|uniref:Uncharacterized protein n=1 Tax=Actinomadura alba TaxID=406431 RepID=A0ABR7LVN8_9ACTN|nr:hypothetical protein [Actinomadura alba]
MFNRPPLEERIAARQRELGPLKPGRHFEHRPAAIVFFALIVCVVLTHVAAFFMIELAAG